jgi:hypothetical protein
MTIWVPDCQAAHAVLSPRRAVFLTPPVAWSGEIRAFLRDPGGHPLEIIQVR